MAFLMAVRSAGVTIVLRRVLETTGCIYSVSRIVSYALVFPRGSPRPVHTLWLRTRTLIPQKIDCTLLKELVYSKHPVLGRIVLLQFGKVSAFGAFRRGGTPRVPHRVIPGVRRHVVVNLIHNEDGDACTSCTPPTSITFRIIQ